MKSAADRAWIRARKRENRAWLDEIKSAPCADCGGSFDPFCMDFDHRPEEQKTCEVSRLITCSRERILEEIEKCDLVCAICHRLRTKRRLDETGEPGGEDDGAEDWPTTSIKFQGGAVVRVQRGFDPW